MACLFVTSSTMAMTSCAKEEELPESEEETASAAEDVAFWWILVCHCETRPATSLFVPGDNVETAAVIVENKCATFAVVFFVLLWMSGWMSGALETGAKEGTAGAHRSQELMQAVQVSDDEAAQLRLMDPWWVEAEGGQGVRVDEFLAEFNAKPIVQKEPGTVPWS
eukprot:Skav223727  [mRNA]  locus=scaffold205:130910:133695:+ [translate_table: standard]